MNKGDGVDDEGVKPSDTKGGGDGVDNKGGELGGGGGDDIITMIVYQ